MKKIYILDTSVLAHDPGSFKTFDDGDVVIPVAVLDELDKLKKQMNDAGRNSRVAIKLLDELSELGDISTGIQLESGSLVKIDITNYPNNFGDALYGDTRILACADNVYKANLSAETILVSNDINLRVRAKAVGLSAQSHERNQMAMSEIYEGISIVKHEEAASELVSMGDIDSTYYGFKFHLNECIVFQDEQGNDICLGRQTAPHTIKLLKNRYPWDIAARNNEQAFAIDLIMDPKIPLVTLIGQAGTGKSLVTLASALELVLESREYEKFVIYRPIQPVGNDIGYLPGTMDEKLAPWFQAIMDNFEILFTSSNGDKWKTNFEMYKKKERIQMEALTYIRGRSIPNAIILLDECQNITKEEIKTVLTRAGEGTKIILTGDVEQIDNDELDALNNGLTYVIEKFKDSPLAGHVTFKHGERSALATEAAKVL